MGSLRQQFNSTRRIMKYLVVMAVCIVGVCMARTVPQKGTAVPLEESPSKVVGPRYMKKMAGNPLFPALIDLYSGDVLIRNTRQARDDIGYGVAPVSKQVGSVKIQTYREPDYKRSLRSRPHHFQPSPALFTSEWFRLLFG